MSKGQPQVFAVNIVGVTFANRDGRNRQEVVKRAKAGQSVRLVREPKNRHDKFAIAVLNQKGQQLGYLPGGDARLATFMDKGGRVEARIKAITGGSPGCLGRLFGSKAKTYGCVVEITKFE